MHFSSFPQMTKQLNTGSLRRAFGVASCIRCGEGVSRNRSVCSWMRVARGFEWRSWSRTCAVDVQPVERKVRRRIERRGISPRSRIMAFSLVIALLVLMATGSGRGRGRGKGKASKRARERESSTESDSESEYEEEPVEGKGKAPMTSRKKKGAESPPRQSTGGPVIRERSHSQRRSNVGEGDPHVSSKRRELFQNRSCIGERHVNFNELCHEVPDFKGLMERTSIEPLGQVPAKMGFCVELLREFYMHAVVLHQDHDTGTFTFETTVRGIKFDVTPTVIGAHLGLAVDTTGMYYTSSDFQFETVVNAICKEGTYTNRLYVESRELKPEYHILSLIICYNLLPTLGTKRIRWDRLLLLYLLGHPESAYGINVNIPFLIWQQMVHIIEGSNRRELLPYPLLITRLLDDHGVDIRCTKYDYGLGSIDALTLAKSISTLRTFGQSKGYSSEATPSAPPQSSSGPSQTPSEPPPESYASEVRELRKEVRSLKKIVKQGLKKIFDILSCKGDDMIHGAIAPSTSHAPTSTADEDVSTSDE